MIYNVRYKTNKVLYDSVFIDLKYKPKIGQYDFTKHKFESNNSTTDIVVLKLINNISIPNPSVSKQEIKNGENLKACGLIQNKKGILNSTDILSRFLFYTADKNRTEKGLYIATIGHFNEGFSGGGLYNQNGELVGMVQRGYNNYNTIPDNTKNHPVLKEKIKQAYQNGEKLTLSININFLIKTYLSGYL